MQSQAVGIPMNEQQLLENAKELLNTQNWQGVISLLEPFYSNGNIPIDGLKMLGHSFSRRKRYDKAIVIYQCLQRQQPNNAMWPYCLGYQYQSKGDVKVAIELYLKCLELYPKWLKVYAELAKLHKESGQLEKALKACRDGIETYKTTKSERKKEYTIIYAKLCTLAAKLITSVDNGTKTEVNEAEYCFRESVSADPQNGDCWYRLGDFLLASGKYDDSIPYFERAESLAPKKEYIPHKIAQAYLKKGDFEKALTIYERIPHFRRASYILRGMAQCLLKKGELRKGAVYLFMAAQREPDKWYHFRDLGLVLADLYDSVQAIEFLEKANQLYKQEQGKEFIKILSTIDELKTRPRGQRVIFEKPEASVTTISYGVVTNYNADRGFGFIKDTSDGSNVFFHISKVRMKTDRVEIIRGLEVKFLKETAEKGPQAAKVWMIGDSNQK
jgi:tetratricopeptide (TPR) repeat protein